MSKPDHLSPRITKVWDEVEKLYETTSRPQAKYLWQAHVPVVATYAAQLCDQYSASQDITIAGALFHDVADIWLERDDTEFEEKTSATLHNVLRNDFTSEEIKFIEEKIIAPHSCLPGNLPTTLEGKILATADAMAHLTTNFYREIYSIFFINKKTPEEYRQWVLKKLSRDFNDKLFFDNVREKVKSDHEALLKEFQQTKE